MADIVKFPLNVLDIDGYTLTDDEKDRIVLALQGKALKNPVQDAIDSFRVIIASVKANPELYADTVGEESQILSKITPIERAINKLEDHTNIVSGVAISYTGFPPNFLGRLSIANAYNKTKEALRKTEDGPCNVEEQKSEIFSSMFRSILGHAQQALEDYSRSITQIPEETTSFSALHTLLSGIPDVLDDFKTQDNNAFFTAYNFVNRIAVAQAVINAKSDDFSNHLFENVVGTRIFNTEDIAALKVQCQVWGDDNTPPPSDFSGNFADEFALTSIADLVDIDLTGITEGYVLQYNTNALEAVSLASLGISLDDLSNVSGAASASTGQVLAKSASGLWEPATVSGGGGSSTWTGLTDTPGSIESSKFVRGNGAGSDLEFNTIGSADLPTEVIKIDDSKYYESGGLQFNSGVLSVSDGLSGRHQVYSESTSGKQFKIPDLDGYAIMGTTSGLGCSEGMGLFVSATGHIEHLFITSGMISDLDDVAVSGLYSDLSGQPTNLSDFTNDSGYITGNQTITLSGDVTGSGTTSITTTIPEASVTQHEVALTITESQISDLDNYIVDISGFDTGDLVEGSNLYYTDERVDDRVSSLIIGGNNLTSTYDDGSGTLTLDVDSLNAGDITSGTLPILRGGTGTSTLPFVSNFTIGSNFSAALQGIDTALGSRIEDISGFDTGDLTEGSNLYYTDERVDDRVGSLIVGGNNLTATYDDGAGTLTLDVDSLVASDITSGTFTDARIAESNVTQHESALNITESQISDLGTYYSQGDTILAGDGTVLLPSHSFENDTSSGLLTGSIASGLGFGSLPTTALSHNGEALMKMQTFAGVFSIVELSAAVVQISASSTWAATSGQVLIQNTSSTTGAKLALQEGTANGSNTVNILAPNSLSGNTSWTLPTTIVDNGVWKSNASGILTCEAVDYSELSGSLPSHSHTQIKSATVESPSGTEDISLFFTSNAITISQMTAVLRGSSTPSVTWTIRHNTDRSAAGAEVVTSGTTTTSTTTGSVVTSFNDATIPANSFIWLETTAQSGTVNEINISIEYSED